MKMVMPLSVLLAACTPCRAVEAVRLAERSRRILTGPFTLKAKAPQERLDEFKHVDYPAVTIENEYLRCTVLPSVGGRLYEVYNKASKSQLFFVNPYLETHPDDFEGGHPWNLGGVEVNFPYFHHGNTYNDAWQWAKVERPDGTAGVVMSHTSTPTMQRAVFRVLLRPGVARVDLEYDFENLNPYGWGLAAWIDTMHPKTMDTQFILPTPWVAQHGHNAGRTDLQPWPVRNGVDLSWQRNLLPGRGDLSEFGFMPRERFHGCYEHKTDRGAVRIFDPATLPAAKLWTQTLPVSPERYYQHFEIWTATSAVMEDPGHQPELSAYRAADSWYQVWGIGGYVFANEHAALNLARQPDGKVLAGVCGTRHIPGCVVSLRHGRDSILRETFDLDPAKPWRREVPVREGDMELEVVGPDGARLAAYELRADEVPQEQWKMPEKPRWQRGLNAAYYDEDYSTLWRRRGHFLDGALRRFAEALKQEPGSAKLMIDLARCHLKDEQVRVGYAYQKPGPEADSDAAKRREADLASAVDLLTKALSVTGTGNGTVGGASLPREPVVGGASLPREPSVGGASLPREPVVGGASLPRVPSHVALAHFYLGLALERQGKRPEAIEHYRAALKCPVPCPAAALYLARLTLHDSAKEALSLARRAAEAYPQSTRAKHMLMVALAATGQAMEAKLVGHALLDHDPSHPVTLALLGRAPGPMPPWAEAELKWLRGADK